MKLAGVKTALRASIPMGSDAVVSDAVPSAATLTGLPTLVVPVLNCTVPGIPAVVWELSCNEVPEGCGLDCVTDIVVLVVVIVGAGDSTV